MPYIYEGLTNLVIKGYYDNVYDSLVKWLETNGKLLTNYYNVKVSINVLASNITNNFFITNRSLSLHDRVKEIDQIIFDYPEVGQLIELKEIDREWFLSMADHLYSCFYESIEDVTEIDEFDINQKLHGIGKLYSGTLEEEQENREERLYEIIDDLIDKLDTAEIKLTNAFNELQSRQHNTSDDEEISLTDDLNIANMDMGLEGENLVKATMKDVHDTVSKINLTDLN
jgi:hypothetical protein